MLVVLLALPAAAFAPPRDVSGVIDFSGIDEAANEAVASGEIPGVVVLVGRGDDILLQRAYGSRRLLPHPVPLTTDTIFDLASLTKPFATASLAASSIPEKSITPETSRGGAKAAAGSASRTISITPATRATITLGS